MSSRFEELAEKFVFCGLYLRTGPLAPHAYGKRSVLGSTSSWNRFRHQASKSSPNCLHTNSRGCLCKWWR